MTKCQALLFVGDDFGDNHSTHPCHLDEGHEGPHREEYQSQGSGVVVVTWEKDGREKCDHCGDWRHDHNYEECPYYAEDHWATCKLCLGE